MNLKNALHQLTTRRQSSILSASLVLGITFLISAVLGFLRSRFLYSHFFACCAQDLDAYNAAFRLPDLIFKLLVSGALSASFIPVFSNHLNQDPKKAHKMASAVINLLLVALITAAIVAFIFAKPLSLLIAKGFDPHQIVLMVNLTRILLLAQIFFLLSNFVTSILQVNQIFIVPALSPIVYNISIILGILLLAPIFGIYGVAYSVVIGAFFHLLIQIPVLKKLGFDYTPTLNPKTPGVREVVNLMLPRSLSLGLSEIENTITLFFSSGLAVGSLSLLTLAMQLMYLPSRVFATTVGQASLPILSKNVAQNKLEDFKNTVIKTLLQSIFIALPITTIILVNRLAIVRIAFGAKQFPWTATLLTAKTLAFLTPAIICQAVIQILVRSFYALHDTRTPLKISFFSLIVNVASSYYFVTYTNQGIIGLAFSASLANLTQCFGLLIAFSRKVDGISWTSVLSQFNRILTASIFTGLLSWLVLKSLDLYVLDTTRTINVIGTFSLSSLVALLSYIFFASLFRLDQLSDYQRYLGKFKAYLSRR